MLFCFIFPAAAPPLFLFAVKSGVLGSVFGLGDLLDLISLSLALDRYFCKGAGLI
jgi:hypothetical protein